MAEEGVSGGGGATNINVGVKVENESAKQAIQNLAKGVQVLTKELQGTADASAKASDSTMRLGQQAGPAMKESAKSAGDMKAAFSEMATSAGGALLAIAGPLAMLQKGLQIIKEDLKATDDLAKNMEQRRGNFGQAGAGRLTADGQLFSSALQGQLKGTIFGTAEGSQVAGEVARVLPRNATPEQAAALMKTVTPQIAGALGGLKQAAPMVGSAGQIYDLFAGKASPEQAMAYAYSLSNAGLIVNDGNKTQIAQLAAAVGPEKALQMAASATEADVGMKGLFQFLTAPQESVSTSGKGPISMMDQAKAMDAAGRINLLNQNPAAFGALGAKWSAFGASGGGPTLASSGADWARLQAAAGSDRNAANIAGKLQSDVDLQSAKDRDAIRADMRARLSEKLETYIVGQNLNSMEAMKARTKFDYYDDPLTGIYEAAPNAIGMNAGGTFSSINKFSRISGPLREAALRSSGLMAASGETQVTTPRQSIDINVRSNRGDRVSVQAAPVVGGS